MLLEKFEYFCPKCGVKGPVTDVLLNPEVVLIRGYCDKCRKPSSYRVVDLEALRAEHKAARQKPASVKINWTVK